MVCRATNLKIKSRTRTQKALNSIMRSSLDCLSNPQLRLKPTGARIRGRIGMLNRAHPTHCSNLTQRTKDSHGIALSKKEVLVLYRRNVGSKS